MKKTRKHYTMADIKFIKQNKGSMTYREMGKILGHSADALGHVVRRYAGLKNKMKRYEEC